MKPQKSHNPLTVSLFGSQRKMFKPLHFAHLRQQFEFGMGDQLIRQQDVSATSIFRALLMMETY
jgi:hypothetical protein